MIHDTMDAQERFRRSFAQAQIQDLLGMIRGNNTDLASYDAVAKSVRARQQIEMGTHMIPLDQIVGSVGRYKDFTREFLPRTNISKERWTRVDAVMHSPTGWPPIEVYKIGEVYFVRDGNHRVSVAHANGLTHIEAYVTEVKTDIPLTLSDFERDQWLIKAERAEFEDKTRLDELRPDHLVVLTEPGRYQILMRHIEVHQYLRNLDLEREQSSVRLSWQDAVVSWYDNVYLPVVDAINDYQLLTQFPNRTEADLYLWITYHREDLAKQYSLGPLDAETAVSTFAEVYSDRPLQWAVKGLRYEFLKAIGELGRPLGMSHDAFDEARARHDAGEITLSEAESQSEASQAAEQLIPSDQDMLADGAAAGA